MLIVIVLDVGMNMVGVNPWFQQAIYGAIIIVAVALTIDRRSITSSSSRPAAQRRATRTMHWSQSTILPSPSHSPAAVA